LTRSRRTPPWAAGDSDDGGGDAIGLEAERYALQTHEALHEQERADRDGDADGELGHDEDTLRAQPER
jgi:hypothetical protein